MARLTKLLKANKVFSNYFFRVLPIFILPVVALIIVYFKSNQVINQQTYEKNLSVLQNSAETIQSTFANVDSLVSYLDRNPVMNNFLKYVNPIIDGSTTMDMLNAQSDLLSLQISNSIIRNLQLYSIKNNILIDSATNALYLDRYYHYEFVQGMSLDKWIETFLQAPRKSEIITNINVITSGRVNKSIVCVKSLPISESNDFTGVVLIYLDEDYLIDQYKNIPYQNSGFIYIIDGNGKILLYNNSSRLTNPTVDISKFVEKSGYFSQSIDGEDMFVTYYKEPSKNWTYIAALPKYQVLQPTANIRITIIIMIMLTILLGGFILFSSVSRLSRPVSHIFSLIAVKNKDISYNDFEYKITEMVENNEKMKEELNKQIPELKTSIFYNLLIGGYSDADTILQNLSKISIKLDAKHYVVLIVAVNELDSDNNLKEISAKKIYINNILTQYIEGIQGIYNLDFERTVLLLSFDDKKEIVLDKVESIVKSVVENFMTNTLLSVSFAGDITDDIQRIPTCFYNAYSAINYKQKDPYSAVQWYVVPEQKDKSNFYYPIELESQLIMIVNTGKVSALSGIFEKLDENNRKIISENHNIVFYNLLMSMNSTLIRIFNEKQKFPSRIITAGSKIASRLENREDLPQIYYLLKEVFKSITLFNKDEHRTSNISQHSQIIQYIDEHYLDPMLSLTSVADVFQITEVYLSQLFKHISGENFSKYVENLRLKKGHELIVNGFKINDVYQMSGYNSPQVFRRAYKRKYGVTPTEDVNKNV